MNPVNAQNTSKIEPIVSDFFDERNITPKTCENYLQALSKYSKFTTLFLEDLIKQAEDERMKASE
jgi:hypothetical protein